MSIVTPLRQFTKTYATKAAFPIHGDADYVYRAIDTGNLYTWNLSGYVGAGMPDAPKTGEPFCRMDGDWAEIPKLTNAEIQNILNNGG